MNNLRAHGPAPYKTVVVHGGPGAPGSMGSVARKLGKDRGVLEPLQTKATLAGQIQELHDVLKGNGALPVTLVGWSWGAMLGFIFSAVHPDSVQKLVLIGSGVFEEKYAAGIEDIRLARLDKGERREAELLMEALEDPAHSDKNMTLAKLGKLFSKSDNVDPLPSDPEFLECDYDIHRRVWKEAAKVRATGELLNLGKQIRCPVVAIHGDYDPHPSEGVSVPLSATLTDFRFILLENCGHMPWLEQRVREEFYRILTGELSL